MVGVLATTPSEVLHRRHYGAPRCAHSAGSRVGLRKHCHVDMGAAQGATQPPVPTRFARPHARRWVLSAVGVFSEGESKVGLIRVPQRRCSPDGSWRWAGRLSDWGRNGTTDRRATMRVWDTSRASALRFGVGIRTVSRLTRRGLNDALPTSWNLDAVLTESPSSSATASAGWNTFKTQVRTDRTVATTTRSHRVNPSPQTQKSGDASRKALDLHPTGTDCCRPPVHPVWASYFVGRNRAVDAAAR